MMLECDGVFLQFGENVILQGIYLKLQVGDVVGLLGRNGSGKSSLMKTMFGSLTPTDCSLRLNGKFLPAQHRYGVVSYLPQSRLIPSHINAGMAANLFKVNKSEIEKVLPSLRNSWMRTPRELSSGELRFLEALLILKSHQPFCLLDEPFTGLMPLHIEALIEVIKSVSKEKGVLISDHMYKHVMDNSGYAYLLKDGRSYKINDQADLIDRGYLIGY